MRSEKQIQFLLTGATVTQVREDIRAVDVVARTLGNQRRLDPTKLLDMSLNGRDGKAVPLSQIGRKSTSEKKIQFSNAVTACRQSPRSAMSTTAMQPPDVSAAVAKKASTDHRYAAARLQHRSPAAVLRILSRPMQPWPRSSRS